MLSNGYRPPHVVRSHRTGMTVVVCRYVYSRSSGRFPNTFKFHEYVAWLRERLQTKQTAFRIAFANIKTRKETYSITIRETLPSRLPIQTDGSAISSDECNGVSSPICLSVRARGPRKFRDVNGRGSSFYCYYYYYYCLFASSRIATRVSPSKRSVRIDESLYRKSFVPSARLPKWSFVRFQPISFRLVSNGFLRVYDFNTHARYVFIAPPH